MTVEHPVLVFVHQLLQQYKADKMAAGDEVLPEDDEANWTGWEHESDDESDFEDDGKGWINVGGSDDEDIHISDSEDEDNEGSTRKKVKLHLEPEEEMLEDKADETDEDARIKFKLEDDSDSEEDIDSEAEKSDAIGHSEPVPDPLATLSIQELMSQQV